MTAPTHVIGVATVLAPVRTAVLVTSLGGALTTVAPNNAALSAVQLGAPYPSGSLYPSVASFPGQTYVTVGIGGAVLASAPTGAAVLAPEALAAAAIQQT